MFERRGLGRDENPRNHAAISNRNRRSHRMAWLPRRYGRYECRSAVQHVDANALWVHGVQGRVLVHRSAPPAGRPTDGPDPSWHRAGRPRPRFPRVDFAPPGDALEHLREVNAFVRIEGGQTERRGSGRTLRREPLPRTAPSNAASRLVPGSRLCVPPDVVMGWAMHCGGRSPRRRRWLPVERLAAAWIVLQQAGDHRRT
jgi:hypothetical protein